MQSAIPALEREREEEHKFKTILGYVVSWKPAWATQSPPFVKGVVVVRWLSG